MLNQCVFSSSVRWVDRAIATAATTAATSGVRRLCRWEILRETVSARHSWMYPARSTSTITEGAVELRLRPSERKRERGSRLCKWATPGEGAIDMQVRRHRRAPRRLWMLVASRKRMRTINALPGSLSLSRLLCSLSPPLVHQPVVVARYLSTCRAALWLINSCFLRIAVARLASVHAFVLLDAFEMSTRPVESRTTGSLSLSNFRNLSFSFLLSLCRFD